MTKKDAKHGEYLHQDKAGDSLYESGELSTEEGDFQKLFIFQGQFESMAAHSIQT